MFSSDWSKHRKWDIPRRLLVSSQNRIWYIYSLYRDTVGFYLVGNTIIHYGDTTFWCGLRDLLKPWDFWQLVDVICWFQRVVPKTQITQNKTWTFTRQVQGVILEVNYWQTILLDDISACSVHKHLVSLGGDAAVYKWFSCHVHGGMNIHNNQQGSAVSNSFYLVPV